MMNNLRENNISIFNVEDPDPTKWKKVAHVEDPLWGGKYPNPFHMVFSIDSSKLYLSILHPSPAASGIMVVDTATWKIKKEIQGIGPDLQTPAITYDGKFVLCPFSGFQRLSSGVAVIERRGDVGEGARGDDKHVRPETRKSDGHARLDASHEDGAGEHSTAADRHRRLESHEQGALVRANPRLSKLAINC
jgi:hypothetical protein